MLQRLEQALCDLRENLNALQLTLSEDRPVAEAPALVDRFDDQAVDLLGAVEECLYGVARVQSALLPGVSRLVGLHGLRRCHEQVQALAARYSDELASYEAIESLLEMGRERGPAWAAWSRVARQAIEQCEAPIRAAQAGLVEAWCALFEHFPTLSARPGSFVEQILRADVRSDHGPTAPTRADQPLNKE